MAKMRGKYRPAIQNTGFNIERYEKEQTQREVDEALEELNMESTRVVRKFFAKE